jgi:hypothetical protein
MVSIERDRPATSSSAPHDAEASAALGSGGSWIDRLQGLVDRAPIPWWAVYAVGFLLLQLAGHALRWADGSLPPGQLDPWRNPMFGAFFPAWTLAAMHGLDRVASRQLDTFRLALANDDDATVERHRTALVTLPARPVALITVVAGVLPAALFVATANLRSAAGLPAWVLSGLLLAATTATGVLFMFHAVHQLAVVTRLHARAEVDLFRPQPLSAFSVLAARSGIAFLVLAWYAAGVRPDLVLANPVGAALVAGVVGCGLAAFVLPLVGLHERLAEAKGRLLDEADERLRRLVHDVWDGVDARATDRAEGIDRQLESVQRSRTIIADRPTWPWATPTLTGFVSAFVLPIAIWAVTFLVERLAP